MKKIFEEFKKFITKGNVVDLAVGMIIGAAFTAIVNALVNNIFKPLINAIPMEGVEGLITMLVPRDANGIKVAADYLADLFEAYGDDDPIILLLYSGSGWDAVEKYKENGFMTQYVSDVLARSAEYERLHGK
jgi:hypothetical protein